jgi:hypothetical protein
MSAAGRQLAVPIRVGQDDSAGVLSNLFPLFGVLYGVYRDFANISQMAGSG